MHRIALILLSTLAAHATAGAQTMTMRAADGAIVRVGSGQTLILRPEGSAIVIDGVVVDSGATQPALERGDRIVRVNGRRDMSLEALVGAIRTVEVGAEVVLGIVRGTAAERDFRFRRPPPPSGGETIAVQGSAAGSGAWTTAATGAAGFNIAGFQFAENSEGMPAVTHRGIHPAASTVALRSGDVAIAFDGRPISALAGLQMFYERASPGATIRLTVKRAGKDVEVSFVKPAP